MGWAWVWVRVQFSQLSACNHRNSEELDFFIFLGRWSSWTINMDKGPMTKEIYWKKIFLIFFKRCIYIRHKKLNR